jgi:hypothetical protein
MADRAPNYTLSCPCKGLVIEGDLVKVDTATSARARGS